MTDLILYRVDGRGRINLESLLAEGVEFYTAAAHVDADGAEDGTIVLSPVKVVSTSVKRSPEDTPTA